MPTVIPVKFSYATRDLWFDPAETGAVAGDHVICATERGTEVGLATQDPFEVDEAELKRKTDGAALKQLLRVATDDDLDHAAKLAQKGDEAFPTFRRLVSASGLDMKPVAVEYLFGGEKVVCYFAAEERVDFRQLVRDLARTLHERVDMRQIGVREETALMGGFAHCGQELCCARFGSGFEPVSIRMAKEQDLPLNSNKISGACGRLMCCLRYEFEAYRDFKQRAPKKNAVIQTPLGTAKIIEYDTPKEQLCLRLENGKQIRVPLAEMEASEAACKKSEELGCACRPDTVLRSTMDRLASPEVRAALEELDRKNGVLPPETFEADDIFVTEERGGRKRRNKGGNKGGGSAQQAGGELAGGEQAGEGEAPAKRRRRRKTVEISEEQEARLPGGSSAPANESAPGEGRRSRRRRHHAEGEGAEAGRGAGRETRGARGEDAGAGGRAAGEGSGAGGRGEGAARRRRGGRNADGASQGGFYGAQAAAEAAAARRDAQDGDAGERAGKRRERRRSSGGPKHMAAGDVAVRDGQGADSAPSNGGSADAAQGEGNHRRRRRRPGDRGGAAGAGEGGTSTSGDAATGNGPAGDAAPKRRRRHHKRPDDGPASE